MKTRILAALMIVAVTNLTFGSITTVPVGLSPGDQYRLAFITSTVRNAVSSDIEDYNNFVADTANNVPELNALGTTWRAIFSTPSVDARDNTGTVPSFVTGGSTGVPIFLLDGTLVVDGNNDLWTANLMNPINVTELGTIKQVIVYTGTDVDGTWEDAGPGKIWYGGSSSTNYWWIKGSTTFVAPNYIAPRYALSDVLTVVPEPATLLLLGLGGLVLRKRR